MKFLEYINESINDKGIFHSVFIVGHAGSGKSYVSKKIQSGQIEPRIVNTDKMFKLYSKDEWSKWVDIKDKVKTVSKNQLTNYINSMLPLIVDGTGADTSLTLRRKGILESFGYDCAMVFINTSLETALERASKRNRPVDPEYIKEIYGEIKKAKQYYRSKFQDWREINNDSGELTDDIIIKAFKHMNSFFNGKITNPLGKEYMKKMEDNGWKYLDPNVIKIDEIKHGLNGWYSF